MAMGFLRIGGLAPEELFLLLLAPLLVGTGVVFGRRVYLSRVAQVRRPELAALADRLALRIASKPPALPGPGPSPARG